MLSRKRTIIFRAEAIGARALARFNMRIKEGVKNAASAVGRLGGRAIHVSADGKVASANKTTAGLLRRLLWVTGLKPVVRLIAYYFFRRMTLNMPAKPMPHRANVEGSGVMARLDNVPRLVPVALMSP